MTRKAKGYSITEERPESHMTSREDSNAAILSTIHVYLESFFDLVPFYYGTKRPIPSPETGGWWVLSSDEQIERVIRTHLTVNIALYFNVNCRAVAIEWDSSFGQERAKELGVSSRDLAWIRRSPRGYAVIYYKPRGFDLPDAKKQGCPLEFISNSCLLVPPSLHPSGTYYEWIKGPEQLGIYDLDEPPKALLKEWEGLTRKGTSGPYRTGLVVTPELVGLLQTELQRRGAALRRKSDGNWIGHCPFHDDRHPSFSINFKEGLWQCFSGCGAGTLESLAERLSLRVPRLRVWGNRFKLEVPL